MATARERQAALDARKAKVERDKWILKNRVGINQLFKKMQGRFLTNDEFKQFLGNPNDERVKRVNKRLDRFQAYESWYDSLVAGGYQPKRFKDADNAFEFYEKLEKKYGTVDNMKTWMSTAATWKVSHPDTKAKDLLEISNRLIKDFGTIENYTAQGKIRSTLASLPDYVKKAYGEDTIRKALAGTPGYEKVIGEMEDFQAIYDVLKAEGMDTGILNPTSSQQIIGKYANSGNYARFLQGADLASLRTEQFGEYASLGIGQAQNAGNLQQQIYEGNDASLQQQLAEFSTRKKYQYAATAASGAAGAHGANPNLGAWWDES